MAARLSVAERIQRIVGVLVDISADVAIAAPLLSDRLTEYAAFVARDLATSNSNRLEEARQLKALEDGVGIASCRLAILQTEVDRQRAQRTTALNALDISVAEIDKESTLVQHCALTELQEIRCDTEAREIEIRASCDRLSIGAISVDLAVRDDQKAQYEEVEGTVKHKRNRLNAELDELREMRVVGVDAMLREAAAIKAMIEKRAPALADMAQYYARVSV